MVTAPPDGPALLRRSGGKWTGMRRSSCSIRMGTPPPVFRNSELVIGLVAPVGTDLNRFMEKLRGGLSRFNYEPNVVRLSALLGRFGLKTELIDTPEEARINSAMSAGTELRTSMQNGEVLAWAAVQDINAARSRDAKAPEGSPKLDRAAHVLSSLKHPDEVWALRRIYGSGFFLIGVVASPEDRRRHLIHDRLCSDDAVERLFKRDEDEGEEFGQRTRDTFALADCFLPLEDGAELERFLDLVFGYPFHTPTLDEYAMFMAFTAALRSGDLSRQVGAVVVSSSDNIIGVGANDVPRAGGGLYWPGSEDRRDWRLGYDANERERRNIGIEIVERLFDDEAARRTALTKLEGSKLADITEYGRAVHAEMEALLACARSGSSPIDGALYSTTFPCHNCAKHIVAAGIKKVIFVQPYPKSQALTLHSDSLTTEDTNGPRRVLVVPFAGIGPRRFFDLFSLGLSTGHEIKRKSGGQRIQWSAEVAQLRVPMYPNSYLQREYATARELNAITKREGSNGEQEDPA